MNNSENYLEINNINSKGYGVLPKMVMQDTKLTIEAKAIYAYIVTYAGAGNTAFPSLKKILSDLSIAKNRFYKHRKLLIDSGYLSVTQVFNEKKEIVKNIYTLNQFPKEHAKEESVVMDNLDSDPMVQNEPYPIHQNEPYPMVQNDAHKSNSIKINNLKETDKSDTKRKDTDKAQQLDHELLSTFHLTNTQTFLTESSLKFIALFSKTFDQAYNTVGIIQRAKKKVEKETGIVLIGEEWQEEIELHLRRVVQKIRTDHTIKNTDNYLFKSFCYLFQQCSHQSNQNKNATPDISVTLHNWLE